MIVNSFGGNIGFSSTFNEGSEFYFTFDLEPIEDFKGVTGGSAQLRIMPTLLQDFIQNDLCLSKQEIETLEKITSTNKKNCSLEDSDAGSFDEVSSIERDCDLNYQT